MISKMVTDRQKSTRAVQQAAETHAPLVGEALARRVAPHLKAGEQALDWGFFLVVLGRWLEASAARMVEADEAHAAELADDDPARQKRDEGALQLHSKLIEDKEILLGLFGSAVLPLLELDGAVPDDPVALVRLAHKVAGNLRAKPLPPARIPGVVLDTDSWAGELEHLAAALEQADTDVIREGKEATTTQRAKDQAIADHDRLFGRVATTISAVLKLVDEDRLAERVRPSRRRPGITREEAGEVEPEAEKG